MPMAATLDQTSQKQPAYLLSPLLDFLMLGGGALLCLILMMLFLPYTTEVQWKLWFATVVAANFINHPHFANSYQIFYQNFRSKLTASHLPITLRARYLWAGILFPILGSLFFAICMMGEYHRTIGLAANAMFFLVGWHYVKQGYGVLIVLSVKEKIFFSEPEKKALMINAFAVWIASYLSVNEAVGEAQYYAVSYYMFKTPEPLMNIAYLVMVFTSVYSAGLLLKRYFMTGSYPSLNGSIAYISATYIWLFTRWYDPLAFLVVPVFHSLQYLPFVWRYKINQYQQNNQSRYHWKFRFGLFLAIGFVLGVTGFYAAPALLQKAIEYDTTLFGPTLFIFICWMFINIHHYFMDNAIWRKENKDVQHYLFH